jgi:hypothetical protein
MNQNQECNSEVNHAIPDDDEAMSTRYRPWELAMFAGIIFSVGAITITCLIAKALGFSL